MTPALAVLRADERAVTTGDHLELQCTRARIARPTSHVTHHLRALLRFAIIMHIYGSNAPATTAQVGERSARRRLSAALP